MPKSLKFISKANSLFQMNIMAVCQTWEHVDKYKVSL